MVNEAKQQPSKSQRKELQSWAIFHASDKLRWLGDVLAYDANAAIAEAEKKFGQDATKLRAERRRWPI